MKKSKLLLTLLSLCTVISVFPATQTMAKETDGSNMEAFLLAYQKADYTTAETYLNQISAKADASSMGTLTNAMKKAYRKLITKTTASTNFTKSYMMEYFLTDIDNDGKTDLITQTGTCEADTIYKFYMYVDDKAKLIGTTSGSHSVLMAYPDHNGIVLLHGQMGYEEIDVITYENKTLTSECIGSRDAGDGDYYEKCLLATHTSNDNYYNNYLCLDSLDTSKTMNYYASLLKKKDTCNVKTVSFKGSKMTVNGSLLKTKNTSESAKNYGKVTKYSKQTFTLASNLKIYAAGGDAKPQKVSKSYVTQVLGSGLGFSFHLNKNGKVDKIYITS